MFCKGDLKSFIRAFLGLKLCTQFLELTTMSHNNDKYLIQLQLSGGNVTFFSKRNTCASNSIFIKHIRYNNHNINIFSDIKSGKIKKPFHLFVFFHLVLFRLFILITLQKIVYIAISQNEQQLNFLKAKKYTCT